MKELHLITGKGKIVESSVYPKYSVHLTTIKNGERWTNEFSLMIDKDIHSEKIQLLPNEEFLFLDNLKECKSCKNNFMEYAVFKTQFECEICFKKQHLIV